jgi:sulfate permease, SulP family
MERGRRLGRRGVVGGVRWLVGVAGFSPGHDPQASLRDRPPPGADRPGGSGFATGGSLSKTSVADLAGQKTQMASLVNALFVLLTMLFLASLFRNLPAATLGSVVIDAMLGMVTFKPMRRYFRVNRVDWLFFMGAMVGILFIDIIHGILIGVVLSLLLAVRPGDHAGGSPSGQEPKLDIWVAADRYTGLEKIPGVAAVRMAAPVLR